MWTRRLLIALSLLTTAGLVVRPASAQLGGKIAGSCPMYFELPVTVECGMVAVPEDHRNSDGLSIQIAYARLVSTAANPAPDPVIFIDGGPGHPTLRDIELYTRTLAPIIAQRDVILFDQRGVGFSQPGVDCTEIAAFYRDMLRGQPSSLVEAARACHQRLSANGINLSAYTTTQVAADIPYLATALGYESWNIYGISYGSLVGLVLMGQQPDGLRSAVLDSVLIPDGDVIGDRSGLGAAGFARFFQTCAEDWLCRSAYPDLETVYAQAYQQLNAEPLTRTITDPDNGQPVTLTIDGADFASTSADLLNTDKGRAALPGFIFAGRDGLVGDLLDRQEVQYRQFLSATAGSGTAGNGMAVSVICSDYAPRTQINHVVEAEQFPVAGGSTYMMLVPCPAWDTHGSDALVSEPVHSAIPTLILSGDYDSSTPRSYSEHAAETLTSSQIARFPRAGHGVMFSGQCPVDVAKAFYEHPQAAVDASCAARQPGAPLILTVAATRLLARALILPLSVLAGITVLVVVIGGMARLVARRQTAFRRAVSRTSWLGPVLGGALLSLAFVTAGIWLHRPLDAVVFVIPVMVAVQMALATSPVEEPYLEVTLACPRPFFWLLLERWLVIASLQIPVAALGIAASALLMHDGDVIYAVTQMLSATPLLAGLGVLASARSRQASLGAIIALMTWFGFFAARNHVLLITGLETPLSRPFDLIQSVLWMVHPYLRPDGVIPADYLTNRLITSGVGLALFWWAQALLNDTEYLLTGKRSGWFQQRRGR